MLHYRRDLSNLALQERRLRNHLEKDVAQLEQLQKSRTDNRQNQVGWCLKHMELARLNKNTFTPADCGFEFSLQELEAYLERTNKQFRLMRTRPCFDKFLTDYRKEQLNEKRGTLRASAA